ncbi:glycosyltransferase family 2 protein [Spirosoma pulveris]
MPALTVLMPVYNAEKHLAEAIDSILAQTFTDFVFLIIDDGSTDNSPSIIRAYSDPRIVFCQNEHNMGISATLNRGIAEAPTELIARMDADDVSYPDRLQKQYAYMIAHPDCALLSAWVRVVDEEKAFVRLDVFPKAYYYYNLTFMCWIYHPIVMYRRSAVLAVGGYSERYSEDYALFWALSRAYKMDTIETVLLDYRLSAQSLHQVVHKREYEEAQQAQVMRSIRSYTGDDFHLSMSQLECLRHNFNPLLEENSVSRIVECLAKLAYISQRISATPNLNLDPQKVEEAARGKRDFILRYFTHQLRLDKGIWLLIRTGSWRLGYRFLRELWRKKLLAATAAD